MWSFVGAIILSSCLFPAFGVVANPEGSHWSDQDGRGKSITRCTSVDPEREKIRQRADSCEPGEFRPNDNQRQRIRVPR